LQLESQQCRRLYVGGTGIQFFVAKSPPLTVAQRQCFQPVILRLEADGTSSMLVAW
jgi:hypothetical protein